MSITAQQAREVYEQADLLYSEHQVEAALTRMAAAISARLSNSNPLVLCVMTGGMVTTGKLLTQLDFPLQVDYIHVTRYRGATLGGELQWVARPACSPQDRVIIVIDDILDEGVTLAAIIDEFRELGAREVYSAVLVDKLHERKHDVQADFVGLMVEDRYVFGYGMDYHGYLRNAPGIYAVKQGVKE
ncbi:MAG: hypoxanthine-guanine phosphoribosyltransferase [Gammaproteobacteria bacterium]